MMQTTLNPSSENQASTRLAPNRRGQEASVPDLVLLHGLFGQLSNFEPIFGKIDPSYNIWVPELPLYVPTDGPDSIPDLALWLQKWLEERDIRSAVLVGNSLGGHVAAFFAAENPSLVDSLVLVGSSGLYEAEFGVSTPRRSDRNYIREKANEAFHQMVVDDGMVDGIQALLSDRDKLAKVLLWARSAKRTPLHHILPTLRQPVALVWGMQDRITPPFVAEHFRELIPEAELYWIQACGHVPMMEQPDAFSTVLNRFLSRHFSVADAYGRLSTH